MTVTKKHLCGTAVDARVLQKLLIYWDFPKQPSLGLKTLKKCFLV